jgi:hypothetical protein
MHPIFARGNSRTLQCLKVLRQAAQTDQAARVALRLEAIMLSVPGLTTCHIAGALKGSGLGNEQMVRLGGEAWSEIRGAG